MSLTKVTTLPFGVSCFFYIYIYAFSRCFYPKRLTIAFRLYIFISMCVPCESKPTTFCAADCNALPLMPQRKHLLSMHQRIRKNNASQFHKIIENHNCFKLLLCRYISCDDYNLKLDVKIPIFLILFKLFIFKGMLS